MSQFGKDIVYIYDLQYPTPYHLASYAGSAGPIPPPLFYNTTNTVESRLAISLGTLVPNSRDRQGKLWLPSVLENNLTTTCPSNTGHKSLSTELLAL